jgi:TIGR02453 family protein
VAFTGIPEAAFDFYDDLEADNSKTFWNAHKQAYDESVRAPMAAIAEEFEDDFGPAKLFRPNRDLRFSADKSPYKTHQGLFITAGTATGWYLEVSAAGVRAAAGCYHADAAALKLIRSGIDSPAGAELQRLIDDLVNRGWELGGDELKTVPRGYAKDHPRIDLLRKRSLVVSQDYQFAAFVRTSQLLDRVRSDWESARPLVDWITGRLPN